MTKSTVTVPSDPAERKQLKTALVEGTHVLQRIDSEKEALKDLVSTIADTFQLEKKVITKLIRTMYKRNYAHLQAENEDFELLYETLVGAPSDE